MTIARPQQTLIPAIVSRTNYVPAKGVHWRYFTVAASERQGRMKRQEIRDWRKYQAKQVDMLRRYSFNQSRKL